jgi:hypothetical protein
MAARDEEARMAHFAVNEPFALPIRITQSLTLRMRARNSAHLAFAAAKSSCSAGGDCFT